MRSYDCFRVTCLSVFAKLFRRLIFQGCPKENSRKGLGPDSWPMYALSSVISIIRIVVLKVNSETSSVKVSFLVMVILALSIIEYYDRI